MEAVPFVGFEMLRLESQKEGYRFLLRLEEEWANGKNRFSKKGEGLFKITFKEELIGIGGITQDPYVLDDNFGRIRRFYIKPNWRRKGIGQLLLEYILKDKSLQFKEISLRTDTDVASRFYEKNGFVRLKGRAHQTHVFYPQ